MGGFRVSTMLPMGIAAIAAIGGGRVLDASSRALYKLRLYAYFLWADQGLWGFNPRPA